MQPPHCQQAGHAAAEHPDHIVLQQMSGDVVNRRHREQGDVRRHETTELSSLGQVVQNRLVVAHRRRQQTDPRSPPGDAGKLDREIGHRGEREPGAAAGTDSTAGGQNGGDVSGHSRDGRRIRDRQTIRQRP